MSPTRLLVLLACLSGCKGEPKDTPGDSADSADSGDSGDSAAATPVCAVPAGKAATDRGDTNWDGRVDVSDALWTLRHLMHGGPAPVCTDAADLLDDGILDIGDGLAVLYVLFTPDLELPRRGSCDTTTAIPDAPCGVVQLGFEAPGKVTGSAGGTATADVYVALTSPDLAVQAWSFGVAAAGCDVDATSEAGTAIADKRLDAAGKRDVGFSRADVVVGGATHAGVLSWREDVALPLQAEPWRLLALRVSAPVPSSGCTPCTLSFTDGLRGGGLEVATVVTAGGRSYLPDRADATLQVCAG